MRIKIFLFIITLIFSYTTAWSQDTKLPTTPSKFLFAIQADFLQPSDIVVSKQNHLYVLDGVHSQVKVFSYQGNFLFAFGSKGKRNGQFNFPLGLGIDDQDNIYVADSGNHRVQIFDHRGRFIKAFDIAQHEGGAPADPTDVAVNSRKNRCYVVDNDNHQILVYTKDGSKLVSQWGKRGEARGEFRYPFFITTGSNNTVTVVDVVNTRAQIFDPEGKFVSALGGWGVDRGQFYRPKGVAMDEKNRIFVSDSVLGVVQVFTQYGSFLSVVGDENGAIQRFETPVGIFIDHNRRLYVVEMFKNRVRVFQLEE